jgi:hypothetical protein
MRAIWSKRSGDSRLMAANGSHRCDRPSSAAGSNRKTLWPLGERNIDAVRAIEQHAIVEHDATALRCEKACDRIQNAGLARSGTGMQGYMFTAAEAQEFASPRSAENNLVFQHQKNALEDRMPPERISASVAQALLP